MYGAVPLLPEIEEAEMRFTRKTSKTYDDAVIAAATAEYNAVLERSARAMLEDLGHPDPRRPPPVQGVRGAGVPRPHPGDHRVDDRLTIAILPAAHPAGANTTPGSGPGSFAFVARPHRGALVAGTGVDPVTSRFSGARSAN